MARTEAEIIASARRTGSQDAENVSSPRDSLEEFYRGDADAVNESTRTEVEDHISLSLREGAGFHANFARDLRDSLDSDERISDAGVRKAATAWADAWARVAAPELIAYAKERAERNRENPRRKPAKRRTTSSRRR